MRKKIIVLLAVLILPLSGCLPFLEKEVEVEPVFETYEGTLKSLGGIRVSESATHLLQTEEGDILYVYSVKYNLDGEKYIGNLLEVYGEVTEASDKGKDVLKILDIEIIEALEDESDEVKEQVYTDQGLGFSWNISSDWEMSRFSDYVKFELPLADNSDEEDDAPLDPDYIIVALHDDAGEMTLSEWVEATYPEYSESVIESSVGIDFMPALEAITELQDVQTFYVERTGGYIYEISHINNDEDNRTTLRNTFYDALATFQAIPFGSGYEVTESQVPSTESQVSEESAAESKDAPEEVAVENEGEEDDSETTYDEAMSYIGGSIATISPEDPVLGGSWIVTKYEFSDPYYVYVHYEDGHDSRMILMQYGVGPGLDYEVLAYFYPGEHTDWDLISGVNEAAGSSKNIIETGDSAEVIIVMEGYRYFESGPYDFMMQYPSSWYYSGGGGHYSFSDSTDGAELIGLDISKGDISSKTGFSVALTNGKSGKSSSAEGLYGIYVERDDESCYFIQGGSGHEDIILEMAGSIVD